MISNKCHFTFLHSGKERRQGMSTIPGIQDIKLFLNSWAYYSMNIYSYR